jgi:hypothetical protein
MMITFPRPRKGAQAPVRRQPGKGGVASSFTARRDHLCEAAGAPAAAQAGAPGLQRKRIMHSYFYEPAPEHAARRSWRQHRSSPPPPKHGHWTCQALCSSSPRRQIPAAAPRPADRPVREALRARLGRLPLRARRRARRAALPADGRLPLHRLRLCEEGEPRSAALVFGWPAPLLGLA